MPAIYARGQAPIILYLFRRYTWLLVMVYIYVELPSSKEKQKVVEMMSFRSCFAASLALASIVFALPSSPKQKVCRSDQILRFTSAGTFQISVFEDLHYGEGENTLWGPLQDVYSEVVMNAVLDNESPQLVVLNGDLITGENTFLANSTSYVDEIVRPLVQRNLTWASTYGNHDSDYNLSSVAILAKEKTYSGSLTQSMVTGANAGVSNYYLEVYSSDTSKTTPELILWFFDSRGGKYYQQLSSSGSSVQQPNWVDSSVATWFTETNAKLQTGTTVIPSLAFVHIPVNAMAVYQTTTVSSTQAPGINDDNPLAAQGQDIPFMQALLNTTGLMAVFSGHDHGDDWCFKWNTKLPGMTLTGNGLDLCFGRHSGYGGYGDWTRGSRQILLNESTLGKQTETWIRLLDSSVSGKVTLNSTFGTDVYPVVTS